MRTALKLITITVLAISLFSCGGNSGEKKSAKQDKEAFDIGFDTAAIKTTDDLLEAARKFQIAKAKDVEMRKADANYKGHYLKLVKMQAYISKKGAEMIQQLPGNERPAFNEKMKEIMK